MLGQCLYIYYITEVALILVILFSIFKKNVEKNIEHSKIIYLLK
jgi:hypothetical protein